MRVGRKASRLRSGVLLEALSCKHVRATPQRPRRAGAEASSKYRTKSKKPTTRPTRTQPTTRENTKRGTGAGEEDPKAGPQNRRERPDPNLESEPKQTGGPRGTQNHTAPKAAPNRRKAGGPTGARVDISGPRLKPRGKKPHPTFGVGFFPLRFGSVFLPLECPQRRHIRRVPASCACNLTWQAPCFRGGCGKSR